MHNTPMDMTNLDHKAHCCRSDLRFLLSILPPSSLRHDEIRVWLRQIEGSPTDEQLNAAWKLAAIIHEQIRNAK